MKKLTWKRIAWGVASLALLLLLARAFRPTPILVDAARVSRGPLRVTVDDDGHTRVRERYTISAPIRGRLLRTLLEPGDAVLAGETLVAEFVPVAPEFLDARSRREAEARVGRAEAAFLEAEAHRERSDVELRFARSELERIEQLRTEGIETEGRMDRAVRDERSALQALRAAEFGVQVAAYELEFARTSLMDHLPTSDASSAPSDQVSRLDENDSTLAEPDAYQERYLALRSPIDGVVLRVFEESTRPLPAGTALLEVGNTGALEVVADYLSQDAVKIELGMTVLVENWGGEGPAGKPLPLRASVRLVEPGGFTKVSALGVEERRVNIVADPSGDVRDWASLGDGFHVELRIVLWEAEDVLIVPTGALFRSDDAWAVFVVERGVARHRTVEIGRRSALEAQVLRGLEDGERVVLYPSGLLGDGSSVAPRG